nr:class I SAM-dependent methyltransferase [Pedobacter panaciterrae]
MDKETIRDIIDWDTANWWRAIDYLDKNALVNQHKNECLELGAARGGLSLWLALKGNSVLCTDLKNPESIAAKIHNKYECSANINYAALDATDIPFKDKFDIITFKSILGGISQNNRNEYKAKTLNQIHAALKPGGMLLFTENLSATGLHRFLRSRYGTPGWNYLKIAEIEELFSAFKSIKYTTTGFFGCFGRNEKQRIFLGRMDGLLEFIIPKRNRYILSGIATK